MREMGQQAGALPAPVRRLRGHMHNPEGQQGQAVYHGASLAWGKRLRQQCLQRIVDGGARMQAAAPVASDALLLVFLPQQAVVAMVGVNPAPQARAERLGLGMQPFPACELAVMELHDGGEIDHLPWSADRPAGFQRRGTRARPRSSPRRAAACALTASVLLA